LLLPVLCWVAIGLVTSAFAEGHDPLYPLRVVGAGVVLFLYRKSYMEFFARPSVWSWPLGAAVGAVWLLPILDAPLAAEATAPVPTWSSAAYWAWVVCRVVGAVILIPVCEELAFRGYLARFLTKRDFWDVSLRSISLLAIALSSLAFGLIHDRWLLGALTGVAYALLVRSTGKLADAIAAHAASNAVIAAWVLSTGNFQYW
jgi:exosortase E/protease (VPEID-CTERM system)